MGKEVAKKMKEEAEKKDKKKVETSSAKQESPRPESTPPAAERKSSITAGLGRIPKISKEKTKEQGPSFGDLLGGLDAQKPKTIIKNKDLMDSLLNTSASPTKSSRKEEREGERRREEKKRNRDSNESRAREKDERLKEKE